MEKLNFFANNQMIDVDIEITKNKNMYLKIRDNRIVVLVPKGYPEKIVKDFVASHYAKFTKHLETSKKQIYISVDKQYFYVFGKQVFYEMITGFQTSKMVKKGQKHFLQATDGNDDEVIFCIKNFIKEKLTEYISKKMAELEKELNLKKHAFKISAKTKSWGTNYLSKGLITFAEMLGHYREEVIDYVIVHELAHDIFADHSINFWKEVQRWIPNYKELRAELKNSKEFETD